MIKDCYAIHRALARMGIAGLTLSLFVTRSEATMVARATTRKFLLTADLCREMRESHCILVSRAWNP